MNELDRINIELMKLKIEFNIDVSDDSVLELSKYIYSKYIYENYRTPEEIGKSFREMLLELKREINNK